MTVTARAESLNLGITWNPNDSDALLMQYGAVAVLVVRAYMDDPDKRRIAFRFGGCRAALLGPPNDEARSGHRLWRSGLAECLWAAEVRPSDWVDEMETRNRVHDRHKPEFYADLRHVVLLLKEHTFECVYETMEISRPEAGTITGLIRRRRS